MHVFAELPVTDIIMFLSIWADVTSILMIMAQSGIPDGHPLRQNSIVMSAVMVWDIQSLPVRRMILRPR